MALPKQARSGVTPKIFCAPPRPKASASTAPAAYSFDTDVSAVDEVRRHLGLDRPALVGHSYGGKWAMFASCLYEKFACGVWSDPGIVFDEARSNVNYWEPWYLGFDPQRRRPAAPWMLGAVLALMILGAALSGLAGPLGGSLHLDALAAADSRSGHRGRCADSPTR